MNVVLYNFEKKKNSTRRPTGGSGFVGQLAEDFSLLSMTVGFATIDATTAPNYNYAYIQSFRRYYFIEDWIFSGGIWYARLTVDVLATYRTEISDSYQFVTRSASARDDKIVDTFPLCKAQTHARISSSVTNNPFNLPSSQNGVVVMGVVNSLGRDGAVTYYMLQLEYFRQFMGSMLNSISWAGISGTEISAELQKALINPTQYIVSCMYFMVPWSQWSGSQVVETVTTIKLGWWDFSVPAALIIPGALGEFGSGTLLIPKHPQVSTLGEYVNSAPYSKYTLTFLPFGVFEIDSTDLCGHNTLYWSVNASLATGDAILNVSVDGVKANAILTSQCNIGVQLPVGQIAANLHTVDQAISSAARGVGTLSRLFLR